MDSSTERLHPRAWVALVLSALFSSAEALCSVFISVYFWSNSQDFTKVCAYYAAIYGTTPVFFILAGWYAQARDRVEVYRLGLVLHAVFYAVLLSLRERSPDYAVYLGMLLGATWGVFWAGANTFHFDVTAQGRREYFFGLLSGISGLVSLSCPVISGLIIKYAAVPQDGYHRVFTLALGLYLLCFAFSFLMPRDNVRRPFRIRRALFPGKDQRDWRMMMWASLSMTGAFNIFPIVLSLLMYMHTNDELSVGGYASVRALAAVGMAFFVGRSVTRRTRKSYMFCGVAALVLAGMSMVSGVNLWTLFLFGFLQSISGPLFGVPYSGLRMEIILKSAEEPAQRIEYLSAWEVPLAIGRVIMTLVMLALYDVLKGNDLALRLTLLTLCLFRIITYQLVTHTEEMKRL